MTDYHHRKAIESHERARDFQSTHCSTIGHHYVQVEPRLQECLRCGHVKGEPPAGMLPDPVSETEGMGGLVAAMLICGGVLIGAVCILVWLYGMGKL